MESFGARVRKVRERAKKSMSDLAEAMGISVVYVSDIERSRRNPPVGEKLLKLANFLNLDLKEVEEWAHKERKRVELDLDARPGPPAEAALMLARRWDTLSDSDASKIMNILTKETLHD